MPFRTIRSIPDNTEPGTHLSDFWKLALRLRRERLKLGHQERTVLSPERYQYIKHDERRLDLNGQSVRLTISLKGERYHG